MILIPQLVWTPVTWFLSCENEIESYPHAPSTVSVETLDMLDWSREDRDLGSFCHGVRPIVASTSKILTSLFFFLKYCLYFWVVGV